jgi:hypothetical protein
MKRKGLNTERRAAFGPKRVFVAARRPSSARGRVARGCQRNPAVRAGSAPQRLRARAVAAPPFSGPRSRGATQAHNGQPRQRDPGARRAMTPRMGPPPGGTTTALLQPTLARPHSRCPDPSRAWLELMAPLAMDPIGCPASVGRRTYPGPPALARRMGCVQRRAAPKGRKLVLPSAGSFHASRVAHGAVDR